MKNTGYLAIAAALAIGIPAAIFIHNMLTQVMTSITTGLGA